MNLNAITLAISRPGGVRSWDPLAMFTSGVHGVWYDPSDTTTLFRDAAGTLPVTAVEQPVGLMLDKSKGLVLGPELVTNGYFSNGTTGWTPLNSGTVSNVTGVGVFIASGGAYSGGSQTISTPINKAYLIEFDVYTESGGTADIRIDSVFTITSSGTTTQHKRVIFYPNASSQVLKIYNAVSGKATYIDNISVRELPGNHAFNSSGNSANFPVLSARYNLLTKTEQFDDAAWSKYNVTVTPNTTIAPDGTNTADTFTTTSSVSALYLSAFTSLGPSKWSIRAKPGTSRYIALIVGNDRGDQGYVVFDIQDGVVGQTGNGTATTLVSGSITPSSQGFFVCTMSYTRTTSGNCKIELAPTLTGNTFDSSGEVIGNPVGSSAIIWGADLRVANDALNQPAYQRVNTATDYDTVGFKPYLKFNGTNQWLQTNSIDFTYGDKMFVSAGVRKLSDAAVGVIAELSATADTNNGSFAVFNESGSGKTGWGFFSKGTAFGTAAVSSGYTAPITSVLSGTGNIAGDSAILRINGAQAAINTADQGTGNYGNYPMFVGARAGTSLWFNGRLYSLIVAGKLANAVEITETEKYVNSKTAAY